MAVSHRVFTETGPGVPTWRCVGVLKEASCLCVHLLHGLPMHHSEYLLIESLLTQTMADAASPRGRIRSALCLCGRFLSSRDKLERTDEVTWHHRRTECCMASQASLQLSSRPKYGSPGTAKGKACFLNPVPKLRSRAVVGDKAECLSSRPRAHPQREPWIRRVRESHAQAHPDGDFVCPDILRGIWLIGGKACMLFSYHALEILPQLPSLRASGHPSL